MKRDDLVKIGTSTTLLGPAIFCSLGLSHSSGQSAETLPANRAVTDAAIERFWAIFQGNSH